MPLVTLEPLASNHLFPLLMLARCAETARWANLPFGYSVASAESFLQRRIKQMQDGTALSFVLRINAQVAGCGSLLHLSPKATQAEIAFWVGRAYWNSGYGTALCQTLIELARQQDSLDCVVAKCFSENERALRVLKKCGFEQTPKQEASDTVSLERSLAR